jgi:hypothetical protein
MTLLKRDAHYHTYADYLTWSRDYGDELINGTAYIREPPAPSWLHQGVVVELSRQIANALEGKPSRVRVAPLDVRLPKFTEGDDQRRRSFICHGSATTHRPGPTLSPWGTCSWPAPLAPLRDRDPFRRLLCSE